MQKTIDAILLFSGGLDSLLAWHVLKNQGLDVLCVHFISPFFGQPDKKDEWKKLYNLDVDVIDISAAFVSMLTQNPRHGFGSHLNPCMDCKILQLKTAKNIMLERGAGFLATGEVLGQRPMSQRRDSLHIILRDANVQDLLLRPLSAHHLDPIAAERSGIVDRERLYGISGRGRNMQLALAKEFGLKKIPSPAGGCRLTEKENCRRYWQVLKERASADCADVINDFELANVGRQFWRIGESEKQWLCIGRTFEDNKNLETLQSSGDLTLKVAGVPGPVALAREGRDWPENLLKEACALTASFCSKIKGESACVLVRGHDYEKKFTVIPQKFSDKWLLPDWESVAAELKEKRKKILK